jgi:hypothetical protein
MKLCIRAALAAILPLALTLGAFAQGPTAAQPPKGGEKTVEESYLQESLETMIIKEQAQADTKDMKLVALQYAKQAIDAGRRNEEIRKSLEYLALESSNVVIRSGGVGRVTNNFPDIRARACEYLGDFPTVETKDALVRVVLAETEPMVLSSAIRSLGKVGMNDGDEVTQDIAFIVRRFDVLAPDNSLAYSALVALRAIAEKNKGIKDPSAIQAIIRIASGNYIMPVRTEATKLLDDLRKSQLSNASK